MNTNVENLLEVREMTDKLVESGILEKGWDENRIEEKFWISDDFKDILDEMDIDTDDMSGGDEKIVRKIVLSVLEEGSVTKFIQEVEKER